MKFLVFLGPNLKAVTGNSEGIDDLVKEVKDLVVPFETSELNVHFFYISSITTKKIKLHGIQYLQNLFHLKMTLKLRRLI
jgi:hypothetical protein